MNNEFPEQDVPNPHRRTLLKGALALITSPIGNIPLQPYKNLQDQEDSKLPIEDILSFPETLETFCIKQGCLDFDLGLIANLFEQKLMGPTIFQPNREEVVSNIINEIPGYDVEIINSLLASYKERNVDGLARRAEQYLYIWNPGGGFVRDNVYWRSPVVERGIFYLKDSDLGPLVFGSESRKDNSYGGNITEVEQLTLAQLKRQLNSLEHIANPRQYSEADSNLDYTEPTVVTLKFGNKTIQIYRPHFGSKDSYSSAENPNFIIKEMEKINESTSKVRQIELGRRVFEGKLYGKVRDMIYTYNPDIPWEHPIIKETGMLTVEIMPGSITHR